MRTESQMMELVRVKLGRRRRRRRTVAASAGGGVAAALLAVVLLAGGAGQQGAVDDVHTGPGPGSSSTMTTIDPDVGAAEEDSPTTTVPPSEAPDTGGGAAPPDGDAPSAGPRTAPATDPTTVPADPGVGSATGGDPDGDVNDDVAEPPSTTTTTTEPGAEPFVQQRTESTGDLTMTVTARSDPNEPGNIAIRIQADDPTGTLVRSGERYGVHIGFQIGGGYVFEFGDPVPSCDGQAPYTVEPALFEDTVDIVISVGAETDLVVTAEDMTCHPEASRVEISMQVQAN